MKHLLLLSLLCGCATTDIVVKGHVEGQGVVASNGKRTLLFAKGTAEAGLYQVDSAGELRLTRPLVAATDAIRVIDRDTDQDVTVAIGEPLPAWTEPIVRSLITGEEVAALGLTFVAP